MKYIVKIDEKMLINVMKMVNYDDRDDQLILNGQDYLGKLGGNKKGSILAKAIHHDE